VATLTLRHAQAEELLFLANRLLKPKPPLRSQRHTLTEFLAKLAKGSGGSPPWQQVSTTWLQHARGGLTTWPNSKHSLTYLLFFKPCLMIGVITLTGIAHHTANA
jgi:hypothetical protein